MSTNRTLSLLGINPTTSNKDTIKTIAITIAGVLLAQRLYHTYKHWDTQQFRRDSHDSFLRMMMWMPRIGPDISRKIDEKLATVTADLESCIADTTPTEGLYAVLPKTGISKSEVDARLSDIQAHYPAGKVSGAVYANHTPVMRRALQDVWSKTYLTNPLHNEWPGIRTMQAEVISMCRDLMHGKEGGHGIMTHGGTTSIIEACLAYVKHARENGIETPEIIVPETAHVAFDKAADLLHVKLVKVPVDPKSGAADVKAMKRAINSNTCMMVGSAPSFSYGVIDPIEELAQVAKSRGVPLHVDACLGGFLTPFAKEAGYELPPCDFSVDGVTSISMDTHKYGQTPKGTSVLLFHPSCKATPTQTYLDWVGGMYVTDSMDGSRSGADIATTWTAMAMKGRDSYVADTKAILLLKYELAKKLEGIEGIELPYEPTTSVVGVRLADKMNPALIVQKFQEQGWSVNVLQNANNKVEGFHFCLTAAHTNLPKDFNFIEKFGVDLEYAIEYAKRNPNEKATGQLKAYGMLEQEGIPHFIKQRIGRIYAETHNRLPMRP